jgi:hypothetical protein
MGGGSFPLGYGYPLLSAHANRVGVHRNFALEGVTRDTNSAPLGGVVVQLFRTTDEAFIEQSTSDVNGNYQLSTPYADAHYIVAYKAGSPDVAGTTTNTLTGS